MKDDLKNCLLLGCAMLAAAFACGGAAAQKLAGAAPYPAKAIRMVVPFAPGGGTDIIARLVAQDLTLAWRHPVVVDNRGGSGGIVGTEIAAKAAPEIGRAHV